MRGEYCTAFDTSREASELPPHARRILGEAVALEQQDGTTSACAENTGFPLCGGAPIRNYLRMRGEYRGRSRAPVPTWELPPHARRIPGNQGFDRAQDGTTSACAENTKPAPPRACSSGNYLRMRGEYAYRRSRREKKPELPPHARRIPHNKYSRDSRKGTTSACAENTTSITAFAYSIWNYLRMRGEYNLHHRFCVQHLELPPHARRIPTVAGGFDSCRGTTSACAENTHTVRAARFNIGNYLRMRGEYPQHPPTPNFPWELPPHARRIPAVFIVLTCPFGTTSACAENTRRRHEFTSWGRNYLRMRGEYPVGSLGFSHR